MQTNNPYIVLKKFNSVSNPSSIHGLYPYRGKISALDAKSIIEQLPTTGVLLDPFCGSGTIVYEAQRRGLNAIGIDNNPLAIQIAKAKLQTNSSNCTDLCVQLIEKAKILYKNGEFEKMPDNPARSFHPDTAAQIMSVKHFYNDMDDYIKGVFLGAIALAARGCNGYKWTSTTVGKNIEPKIFVDFFDKMLSKAIKNSKYLPDITSPEASIIKADSRFLSKFITPKSVDFVFTSPPYFDGLDYTAYYGKLIYEVFGINRTEIKKQLIQNVDSYENDMKMVLNELEIVTSDNALIIFVVGDKKIKGNIINGGSFFNGIKKASYIMEREYSGSSSQVFDALNKTDRKEQIVVWDKYNGEIIAYE